MQSIIPRLLVRPERSFFLFGPRGTGKSTWLRETLADAVYVDLLESAQYLRLTQDPGLLEAMSATLPEEGWVVIDEIQKIPSLLDEVHRLIQKRRWRFALSGSSARKLRRGGINLLAGRAITRHIEGLSYAEIPTEFDLKFHLEWGGLPLIHGSPSDAGEILSAYVNTYIKEEIKEEGVVRNVPPFVRFLGIAGQLNGQVVNRQNIAREAAVPRSNVDVYFDILGDTLLGHLLPPYRPHIKVREQAHAKFYWFDSGVARAAAGFAFDPVDRTWQGSALETWMFHELRVYNQTRGKHRPISFYRTSAGSEIDFIIETRKRQESAKPHVVCVEVKMADRWDRKWEKAMRSLASSGKINVDGMYGVYTGARSLQFDGINVLPVVDFLRRLHDGEIF